MQKVNPVAWLFFHTLAIGGLWLAALPLATTALAEEKLHHVLDLVLEPADGYLQITDRIEVDGHERLAMKLAPGLEIDEITIDDEEHVVPEAEDGVIWIVLPSDGEHRVEIAYGGMIESDDAGGGLSPTLDAGGVFLPYGIGWLTNGGAEDDRVTYELTVNTSAPYVAVATGEMIKEFGTVDSGDDVYGATFSATRPTEPPSVFAGDLVIDERQHGDLRLRTYFPAHQRELASTYLDQAAGYVDRFEAEIGTYPYNSFSIIASPQPVGLGFPGLTYVSSQILGMPFMLTRSLAHEILHNWWANGVFVDGAEGNWAEGLTTYMADYALAETEGAGPAWKMRLGWLRDFAALPADRDRPIDSFRSKGHDADQVVGYNKVAMVFHMLKQEIGEDAFLAGLRAFWETHKFESAGWSDLEASFEAASGRELDRFFAPWLRQKGAPALTLDRADLRKSDDGYALDLEISSDSNGYDLLVPVQVALTDSLEHHTVRLSGNKAEATIDLSGRPLALGIDQRHDLFRHLAVGEAPPILRDVTLHADTLTVIATNGSEAIAEVAKSLATRALDSDMRLAAPDDEAIETSPLMLIGTTAEMAPIRSKAGIGPVPPALEGLGTARSWVAIRDGAPPALVVEADDEASLSALLRPLPHYGRQSFLVFEGRKVVKKGVWPTGDNALTQRFE